MGEEARTEVERFAIWHCDKCNSSEFTCIVKPTADQRQRWKCDNCGNEPEGAPVRDVVWASDFDETVARIDAAKTWAENGGRPRVGLTDSARRQLFRKLDVAP